MKTVVFLLVLFLFCSCEKENLIEEINPANTESDSGTSVRGLAGLNAYAIDYRGNVIDIIWYLPDDCQVKSLKISNERGGRVIDISLSGFERKYQYTLSDRGGYTITLLYKEPESPMLRSMTTHYMYSDEQSGSVSDPDILGCKHQFEGFDKSCAYVKCDGYSINFYVYCFRNGYEAEIVSVGSWWGGNNGYHSSCYKIPNSSALSTINASFSSVEQAYELRIYSPECFYSNSKCEGYLYYGFVISPSSPVIDFTERRIEFSQKRKGQNPIN